MNKRKAFFMSAAVIAVSGIFLRAVAISFNAYVSAKIGSESMGLFTLVMSVYGFAVTVATSGVNLSAVRLTAERVAHLSESGADKLAYKKTIGSVLLSCVSYSLLFSLGACGLLYVLAHVIGGTLLSDIRTVKSLRIIALSLPAISISSTVSGCFTGLRKGYKNAISAVIEQLFKIVIISTVLALIRGNGDYVEYSCMAVVGGGAVAEAFSLVLNLVLYALDNKRAVGARLTDKRTEWHKSTFGEAFHIAFPIALGTYARQGLSTAEHLVIPWGLKKSGLLPSKALSAYGSLLGMAFPLVLFPSVVLTSAASLLIPELAEMRELGKKREQRRLISEALTSSLLFSIGTAFVFYTFGNFLGSSVYSSAEIGRYIKTIAPLVPVMYTDTVTDCILKGLGEQRSCMRINIVDSGVSLAFALTLVPLFGMSGYIASVYICEILNFVLSFSRLCKCTEIDKYILIYGLLSVLSGIFVFACFKYLNTAVTTQHPYGIIAFLMLYASLAGICVSTVNKRQKNTDIIRK